MNLLINKKIPVEYHRAKGSVTAMAQSTVNLGTATQFAVLAGSGITNTGTTTITGDVGTFPAPTETGFAKCPIYSGRSDCGRPKAQYRGHGFGGSWDLVPHRHRSLGERFIPEGIRQKGRAAAATLPLPSIRFTSKNRLKFYHLFCPYLSKILSRYSSNLKNGTPLRESYEILGFVLS